jgi:hypothetical protein
MARRQPHRDQRLTAVRLDARDIDAIAESVAARLGAMLNDAPRLVDAATVARLLGVERDWVYEHANQLGGIRLGGPRGRLRFDRQTLVDRLADVPKPTAPSSRIAARKKRPRDGATPPGPDTGRSVPMPDRNRTHAGRRVI